MPDSSQYLGSLGGTCPQKATDVACEILLSNTARSTDQATSALLNGATTTDFAFYEFVLANEIGTPTPTTSPSGFALSADALALLDSMEAVGFDVSVYSDFLLSVERVVLIVFGIVRPPNTYPVSPAAMLETLYTYPDSGWLLRTLFWAYLVLPNTATVVPDTLGGQAGMSTPATLADAHRYFETALYLAFLEMLSRSHPSAQPAPLADADANWRLVLGYLTRKVQQAADEGIGEPIALTHAFDFFRYGQVNIGLRHVYRQSWRPLATQPGELVRTIPLGPGESRKFSTTLTRKRRIAQGTDTTQASETTSETSTTTKSSSEIVEEAARSLKWNVEAQGSFNTGVYSGGLTAGVAGDSSKRSADTSSRLNEAVSKAATKVSFETKVHVLVEGEDGFEQAASTEIKNSNDELSVTYEYRKLQQQYEIATELAEMDTVLFVAEDLPSPSQINLEWIKRYASILVGTLLDESLQEVLRELVSEPAAQDPLPSAIDPFQDAASNAADRIATFNSSGTSQLANLQSARLADIYSGAINAYAKHLEEQEARVRTNRTRAIKLARLTQHLRDNVLHYCRAIWMSEDLDQRMLRFQKLRLTFPTRWTFDGSNYIPAGAPRLVAVYDLIEPPGPIGFFGNYAIFRLRSRIDSKDLSEPTDVITLGDLLDLFRQPYTSESGFLVDPATEYFKSISTPPGKLTREQVDEVITLLPSLRAQLLAADGSLAVNQAGDLLNPPTVDEWAEFLRRKNSTDHVLVDSQSLALRLNVGTDSIVEPFKKVHRFIDVLRANSEYERIHIQNARRIELLDDPAAFDPDVQKVIRDER